MSRFWTYLKKRITRAGDGKPSELGGVATNWVGGWRAAPGLRETWPLRAVPLAHGRCSFRIYRRNCLP